MKKLALLILAVFAFNSFTLAQQEATTTTGKKVLLWENGTWTHIDSASFYNTKTNFLSKLEIPKIKLDELMVSHTGFTLLYNEFHEQASWVAYELTKEETNKIFERTDRFIIDPKVKSGTANDKDYAASGFDRGHLAPASDMGWSATVMAESFYYSNMSPQTPSFNRGVWKRLEELVRTWAIDNGAVYIVTGPILTSDLPSIGPNKVSVPKYYYKVVLDYTQPSLKGIAFIIPNTGSSEPLQQFAVSIDSVEKVSGIDFFPLLPNQQEDQIEKAICLTCWTWKSTKPNLGNDETRTSTSNQCNGITKLNERCSNNTLNVSGYCYLHESQQANQTKDETRSTSIQCSGITKAGSRCKRKTLSLSGKCYQHEGD